MLLELDEFLRIRTCIATIEANQYQFILISKNLFIADVCFIICHTERNAFNIWIMFCYGGIRQGGRADTCFNKIAKSGSVFK